MKGTLSLLAVPLLIASGSSLAQEPVDEVRTVEPEPEVAVIDTQPTGDFPTRMEPGHIRTDTLDGSSLLDDQGEDIGEVGALLIDAESGQVEALLVDVGGVAGIGERTVALPWDAVEITSTGDEGGVLANDYEVRTRMTQQELEDAPEFDGAGEDQIIEDL